MAAQPFLPVILGSDIGVYALARSMHERYGVRSLVVGFAIPGPIAASRILDTVVTGTSTPEILAALDRVAAEHAGERLLLLTNMDWLVRVIVHNRAVLEPRYVIPFVGEELLDLVSDKAEFLRVCTELGIGVPATVVQDFAGAGEPGWEPLPVDFAYPVIAKAASSADYHGVSFPGKKKVYEIGTPQELAALYRALADAGYRGRFLVQDYVPGDDTQMRSVTCYADTSGRVTLRCSARVLLEERTPAARGNPAAMITEPIAPILDAAQRLLEHVGYVGYANFDVKLDPRDGTYRFFEVNPRIGRNNYYLTAAGTNPTPFLVEDVLEGRALEPVTVEGEVLYSVLPHRLLLRYVLDPALRARVRRLIRAGRAVHPLRYRADRSLRRSAYVRAAMLNHYRKYRTYYPVRRLREVAGGGAQPAGAVGRRG